MQNNLDKNIIQFIKNQQVLSLSTCVNSRPHSCNCFYAYDSENNWLICTSEYETKHIQDLKLNNYVSGTIYRVKKFSGVVAGVQFNGYMREAKEQEFQRAKKVFYTRYPHLVGNKAPLWIIELTYIKFTHNKLLGFGKKLVWQKENTK